jgi:hypothetical protein
MTISLQNLRSFTSGAEPNSLLPGQLCFNLADKVVYVGDGTNLKKSFDGTATPGVVGEGWYSMPMDFSGLEDFFVANPSYYGDLPTDNQVLTWSTSLNHPIWTSGGSGSGGQVYTTTNNDVAIASGSSTSDKISAAIGVASPDEGDITIVTGFPGEVYQGLYIFTTQWVRGASYAYPNAQEVSYNPSVSGLPAVDVQQAIDSLDVAVQAAQSTANTANTTANNAVTIANAALPKAGGTMTGTITFAAGQTFPVSGIQDASSSQKGVVQGGTNMVFTSPGVIDVRSASTTDSGIVSLTNSTTNSSQTIALTAAAGKNLQDQINNLSLSNSVILAGTLNASTGLVDSVTPDGTAAGFVSGSALPAPAPGNDTYYVIVSNGGSYSPPGGGGPYSANSGDWFLSDGSTWQYLGVGSRPAYASTTTAGIVQLADNTTTQAGANSILAVTPSGLQSKVSDSVSTTSSTRIASSTAVKTAYDLAAGALPLSGGTMTGTIVSQVINVAAPHTIQFASGTNGILSGITDSTSTTSSTCAASATAVKSAYDLANAAVPRSSFTAKGQLLAGTASATYSALPVGASGYVLAANPACSTGLEWVANVAGDVTGVTGTAPIVVDNTDPQNPIVTVTAASTTAPGVVQLNDTTSSTSTTQALTANQGRNLQDQINALLVSNNLTLAGTIDGSTGLMITVTTEGTAKGFTVGSAMPTPVTTNTEYFTIVTVPGTMTPPGGSATAVNDGDWWLSNGVSWQYLPTGYSAPYASTTVPGVIQLATNAEVQSGTDSTKAVVSSALQSKMSDSTSTTSSTTIASSTAVKSAFDLANSAVPRACYTALGALAAGTGSGAVGTLSVGTTGQFLAANTGCSTGLQWCTLSLACIPCSAFTAKGGILGGTGASTFSALSLGVDNQILSVDNACPTGLKWITASGINLIGYTCSATPFNTALGFGAGDSITTGTCNTAIGFNAGTAITTGLNNVAIGPAALDATSVGGNNIAIGPNALGSSTTTVNNLAIGFDALGYNSAGSGNLAIGIAAGSNVSSGTNNVFIAQGSGDAITTGACNISIGFNSLGGSTTACETIAIGVNSAFSGAAPTQSVLIGSQSGCVNNAVGSVFIGHAAGCTNTSAGCTTYVGFVSGRNATGLSNTYVGALTGCAAANTSACGTLLGFCAGSALTTGNGNTLIGFQSGRNVNSGVNNVAIGTAAFQTATTAANNVAVGCGALAGLTTSAGNTALGHRAMLNASTAANNVVIGCSAGEQISTGSTNVFIGNTAGDAVTTGSSNTIIGDIAGSTTLANNLILAAGTAIKLQVNENGAVGVGTTPSYGTAGQVLKSAGTGAAPAWSSAVYGAFSDSTTQTNVGGASGNAVTLNTTASSNGVSIVSGSQITASVAGVYNIQISLQVEKTDFGIDSVEVWFKKNGTNIANSNTNLELRGGGAKELFALNLVEPLTAGQYLEVWWYSADANVQLAAIAAGTRPAIPSAIVTLTPVGA